MTDAAVTTEVATPNAAYNTMQEDWLLIDSLRGGTRAMRKMGEYYLPKRNKEDTTDYSSRLCRATLFPAFIETVKGMTGRVFAEPMVINDDVPQWIKDEVLDDVDREGRNLHVWVREWFEEGLEYGVTHVLVDSPIADGVKSKADQEKAGIRPYLVRIHPRDVIGWRFTDGKLTQLRVRFRREVESEEFGVTLVTEIRVYDLEGPDSTGRTRVYELVDETKGAYQLKATILTDWTEIPFVTLYTKRSGMMTAIPPLRELAFLNAKHWRMQSDNDDLIETASVPILALIGINSGDDVIIGSKRAIHLPTGANAKYVEHTGSAIKAGRDALADLVEEMRQIGAKLLKKEATGSTKTATQVSDEAARDNSLLGAMVLELQDTINLILSVIASWRGEDKGGTVTMQPNLDPDLDPNTTLTTLLAAEGSQIIAPQTVFSQMQAMGIIPDDLDWEEEQTRVKEQTPIPLPAPGDPNAANNLNNPNPQQGAAA